ncbi:MAG: C45 family autoproteolytic acyltransferase/hydrolase [Anaerolineales bacterium]
MIEAPFPRIIIHGRAYERGQQYGQQAGTYIQYSLAAYHMIFNYYTSWPWEHVRTYAKNFIQAIGNFQPHLVDEMQGIADGAGVPFIDILAINLRTEILNAAFARKAIHECTAFYTVSTLDRVQQIILGENWDWKPATAKAVILLEVAPDQGPNFVTVVEAGLLAKMGMNAAGIGLVTNALTTNLDRGQPDMPYHIILRSILESTSFDGAVELIQKTVRASAANYLIANRAGQVLNLEAGPGRDMENLYPQPVSSGYVHTNHFQCTSIPFNDVGLAQGADSPIREQRMKSFLLQAGNKSGIEAIQAALRDHHNYPYSICCHPEENRPVSEQYATIGSIIMNLSARRIWLTGDNPCRSQYQQLDYGEFLAG